MEKTIKKNVCVILYIYINLNDCCIAKMSTTLFLNCTLYVINQFKKTGMLNMYNLDFQFVKTTGGNDSCLSPHSSQWATVH